MKEESATTKKHVVDSLEDCVWPDPHPLSERSRKGGVLVNDVSRMSSFNGTSVDKIFFPRSEEDIVYVLNAALANGRAVCMRGTKHSMGGQTIAPGGYMLDMKCMNAMSYDEKTETVTCGPGCLWSDLIIFLNPFGKSPRTMQSYCTFSVGGSLSVNAHGITTDYCFAESVASFRIAHINDKGDAITMTVCKPGDELFKCALGGYGLFGVITTVTLKVSDNTALELDTLNVKVEGGEFLHYYDSIRAVDTSQSSDSAAREEEEESFVDSPGADDAHGDGDGDREDEPPRDAKVVIKLARLNILDCSTVQLFVYRRAYASSTITGTLGLKATEMSMKTRILYKWLMPVMREARFAFEASSGQAIDMPDIDGLTRNEALFESAVPLAKLYEPLFRSDDTFILHEFFVPHEQFHHWIELAKPIYKELADGHSTYTGAHRIILLNTTIRYVECDTYTYLSYARNPSGNFAFVLYYRLPRTPAAEAALGELHNRFAVITLAVGGTFYLPYRKCYSAALLERAYPQIKGFAALKRKWDPVGMFTNLWYDQYVRPYVMTEDASYGRSFLAKAKAGEVSLSLPSAETTATITLTSHTQLPRASLGTLVTRSHSYRRLLGTSYLRRQFKDQFLTLIFSFADNVEVVQAMAKHAWDPRNRDDFDIYCRLRHHFHGPEEEQEAAGAGAGAGATRVRYSDRDGGGGSGVQGHWSDVDSWGGTAAEDGESDDKGKDEKSSGGGGGGTGPVGKALQMVRSIKQLHGQKRELTRETVACLSRLGKGRGQVNDYVSFGDNGKLVRKLRHTLGMRGQAWVCHDKECDDDDIAGVLERGSMHPVGAYVPFDYMDGLEHCHTAKEVCEAAAAEADKAAWLREVRSRIPDGSADLVTINQGLHHIPPPRLLPFLAEVRRILRPGGVFIFREHDVNLDRSLAQRRGCPVEMVDLAHSVFNAVTGASAQDERREIRAFRPLSEWREIVVGATGLVDGMMEGLESGDCTCDEMLCFSKPLPASASASASASLPPPAPLGEGEEESVEFPDAPPLVGLIKALLAQLPAAAASTGESVVQTVSQLLRSLLPTLRTLLLVHLPEAMREQFPNAAAITSKIESALSSNITVVLTALEMLEQMVQRMEVNNEVDMALLYPEFFLILPVIDRKVRERPGSASEAEVKVVGFLREYVPALLVTASATAGTDTDTGTGTGSGNDSRDGDKEEEDGDGNGDGDEDGMSVRERLSLVTGQEVLAVLTRMEASLPSLLSPATLAQSGFTVRQQGALAGKFGGRDMASTAANLASYLDRASWQELRAALLDAAATGKPPTKQLMLDTSSKAPPHPWHLCARAFLGSPNVKLTSAGKFGLTLAGLSEFSVLYDSVKQEIATREAAAAMSLTASASASPLSGVKVTSGDRSMQRGDIENVRAGIRALSSTGQILTEHISFAGLGQGQAVTVPRVGKILKATYGYKSLTSRPTNITEGLRRVYEEGVWGSQVGAGEVGTLTVTEELCARLRNPAAAVDALDNIRQGVIQAATFGHAGKSRLKITYRVLDAKVTTNAATATATATTAAAAAAAATTTAAGGAGKGVDKAIIAEMVSTALRRSNVTRNLHVDSGAEYTWFKLCEWMQVEIMDVQVRSLDHTPWYRFPYMEILSTYFSTLRDECAFVARRQGLQAAYGSMAFLTDLIPGAVMAFIFGQLHLLRLPLLAMVDTEGYEDTQTPFVEEVVMFCQLDSTMEGDDEKIAAYFLSVDPNIKAVTTVGGGSSSNNNGDDSDGDGDGDGDGGGDGAMVVVVSIPPFKPFSDLLLNLATFIPSAQVLEISNQTDLQVRVSCDGNDEEEATAWIKSTFDEADVEIVTRYQFAISPDVAQVPGRAQLALKVAVTQLLTLLRSCGDSSQPGARVLRVEQCYDWWNDSLQSST